MITDRTRSSAPTPARTHRPHRQHLAALSLLLVVGLVLFAIDRPRHIAHAALQADKLKDQQFIAEGGRLFAPSCGNAYCHGTGGVGGGAPRLRGKGLEASYLFKTISNGIPGTPMLAFKSEFTEEQIWKLVSFVMSDAKATVDAPEPHVTDKPSAVTSEKATENASSSMTGSVQAGKSLFFDSSQSKSCYHCHSLQGEGTAIGPDLSRTGNRSPRELFVSLILPRASKDPRYAALKLTLKNGDKIVGIRKEEDVDSIRVYDTTDLPAVLRTIEKAEVLKVESASESIMPSDYASRYTMKQLLDLVTFLKSFDSKSPVTLKDLLE